MFRITTMPRSDADKFANKAPWPPGRWKHVSLVGGQPAAIGQEHGRVCVWILRFQRHRQRNPLRDTADLVPNGFAMVFLHGETHMSLLALAQHLRPETKVRGKRVFLASVFQSMKRDQGLGQFAIVHNRPE